MFFRLTLNPGGSVYKKSNKILDREYANTLPQNYMRKETNILYSTFATNSFNLWCYHHIPQQRWPTEQDFVVVECTFNRDPCICLYFLLPLKIRHDFCISRTEFFALSSGSISGTLKSC